MILGLEKKKRKKKRTEQKSVFFANLHIPSLLTKYSFYIKKFNFCIQIKKSLNIKPPPFAPIF